MMERVAGGSISDRMKHIGGNFSQDFALNISAIFDRKNSIAGEVAVFPYTFFIVLEKQKFENFKN